MKTSVLENYLRSAEWGGRECRREFLKNAGIVCIAAAGVSCAGMRRNEMRDAVGGERKTGLSTEEREILRLASLAPSGHNAQPWTVRVSGKGHWIIGSQKSRMLPAVDPRNRELMLSLGAFLENMIAAAGARSMAAEYSVIARDAHDADVLEVRLAGGARTHDLDGAIVSRRTVRKGMLREELRAADITHIASGNREMEFISAGSSRGTWLAESAIEANHAQAWRENAQAELADWIRWSDADALKHRNGLTPEGMEIGGFSGWFVRHFFDRGSVLGKDFRDRTVDMVADQVKNCGGWLLLTSRGSSVPELIETGRRFQRMLLKTRERMIAVHPMTQALEESPWSGQAARALGVDGNIQFILRVGYLQKFPDPVSPRMPVEWFVTA